MNRLLQCNNIIMKKLFIDITMKLTELVAYTKTTNFCIGSFYQFDGKYANKAIKTCHMSSSNGQCIRLAQ